MSSSSSLSTLPPQYHKSFQPSSLPIISPTDDDTIRLSSVHKTRNQLWLFTVPTDFDVSALCTQPLHISSSPPSSNPPTISTIGPTPIDTTSTHIKIKNSTYAIHESHASYSHHLLSLFPSGNGGDLIELGKPFSRVFQITKEYEDGKAGPTSSIPFQHKRDAHLVTPQYQQTATSVDPTPQQIKAAPRIDKRRPLKTRFRPVGYVQPEFYQPALHDRPSSNTRSSSKKDKKKSSSSSSSPTKSKKVKDTVAAATTAQPTTEIVKPQKHKHKAEAEEEVPTKQKKSKKHQAETPDGDTETQPKKKKAKV